MHSAIWPPHFSPRHTRYPLQCCSRWLRSIRSRKCRFRVLRLAPVGLMAILDDALPNHITLFDLAVDPPALWDEQRARVEGSANFGNRT